MKGGKGCTETAIAMVSRMKAVLFAQLLYQHAKPEEVAAAYAGPEAWPIVMTQVVDDCRTIAGGEKKPARTKSVVKKPRHLKAVPKDK